MSVTVESILETVAKVKDVGGSPRFIYVRRDVMAAILATMATRATVPCEAADLLPRLDGIPVIPVDDLPYPYWITDVDLAEARR